MMIEEREEAAFLTNSYLYLVHPSREERLIQKSACRCNCAEDPPEEAAFCTHSFSLVKWIAVCGMPEGSTYVVCESCGLAEEDHGLDN